MTFTYKNGLLPAGEYRSRIPPVVEDLAGNVMKLGIAGNFTVEPDDNGGGGGSGGGSGGGGGGGGGGDDTEPPTATPLEFVSNDDGQSLVITFSEAIDVASLEGILKVRNKTLGLTIPASDFAIFYDADTFETWFVYSGDEPLPQGDYRARIPPGVLDLAGNATAVGYALDFTYDGSNSGGGSGGGGSGGGSGGDDTTPPQAGPLTVAVVGGAHQLSLVFDEAIDPASLAGLLKVRNKTAGITYTLGDFTLAYDADGFRVTFTFDGLLPGGDYRARVAPGVRDLAGNATTVGYALDFVV